MFKDMAILMQTADFVYKALKAYVKTSEGQKELADIETAIEEAGEGEELSSGSSSSGGESSTLEAARAARRASKPTNG